MVPMLIALVPVDCRLNVVPPVMLRADALVTSGVVTLVATATVPVKFAALEIV